MEVKEEEEEVVECLEQSQQFHLSHQLHVQLDHHTHGLSSQSTIFAVVDVVVPPPESYCSPPPAGSLKVLDARKEVSSRRRGRNLSCHWNSP